MTWVLDAYRQDLEGRRLAVSTVRTRLIVARILARQHDLPEMTADDLRQVVATQWVRLAPQTHRSYLEHTSDLCRWMIRANLRSDDPSVDVHRPRVPAAQPRPMPADDLDLALATTEQPLRVWLCLMSLAGLRCVDVSQLDARDVLRGPEPALHVTGKGQRERVVPIGEALLRELHRYGIPRGGPLFRHPVTGAAYSRQQISRIVNRHLHRHGIDDTAHALRHFYGSAMYGQSGRDLRAVQELLGHASPSTTARYVATSTEQVRPAIEQLETDVLGFDVAPGHQPDTPDMTAESDPGQHRPPGHAAA